MTLPKVRLLSLILMPLLPAQPLTKATAASSVWESSLKLPLVSSLNAEDADLNHSLLSFTPHNDQDC